MRVSFLTLCTLTAWSLQNYAATAQAQIPLEPMADDTETPPTTVAPETEPIVVVPSLAPPDAMDFVQFAPNPLAPNALTPNTLAPDARVPDDFGLAPTASAEEFSQSVSQGLALLEDTASSPPSSPAATSFSTPPTELSAELSVQSVAQSPAEEYAQSVEQTLQMVNESTPDTPTVPTADNLADNLDSPKLDCGIEGRRELARAQTPSRHALAAAPPPSGSATDRSDCLAITEPSTCCIAQVDILMTPADTDSMPGAESAPIPLHQLHPGIPPGVPIYRVPETQHIPELLHEAEFEFIEAPGHPNDGRNNGPNNGPTINITNAGRDFDDDLSPLERQPTRLFNLETANQLADNALQLSAGFHQTLSNDSPQSATGGQLYYGSIDWGVTEDIQIGLAGQYFDDPPPRAIADEFPNITLYSIAPNVKYRILDQAQFDLGVQGSVELFSVDSSLFDTDGDDASQVVGSLHVPMTYDVGSEVQLHLTPGVSFFPGSINDTEFYDTIFSMGTGVSWQASERFTLYGTVNVPLGPGGNAISSDDQEIEQQVVWTVGSRYNVTPKVGVDLYATNGLGVTPATGILSFLPEGNDALVGLKLNYTPDLGLGYRSSFRDGSSEELSERDRQLLLDGFTLSTAQTVQPGSVLISAGGGTNDRFHASVAYSPDEDFQIEGLIEEFSSPNDLITEQVAGDNIKYALGAQLRLLNQQQGDPLSLGVRLLGGRDTDEDRQIGTLFADLPINYQVSDRTALFANPRFAAFSDEEVFGLGFGVNHEVLKGLQLIGEVTPVIDETVVWAAGARYAVPQTAVSLDLYASNAAGRNGLGTLVGESDTNVGFNFNWLVGDR
ncbi:MAG: hypothetical protein F6K30_06040 [Cyanothece sp. SIO2G6]|nr:hypothetical protein [Cyanothece sp. SIO2G6]